MELQKVVDWARSEPWLALLTLVIVELVASLIWEWCTKNRKHRFLTGLILATVLTAFVLNELYPPKKEGGRASTRAAAPTEVSNPGTRLSPPPITDLTSLLEQSRQAEGIRKVFAALGERRIEPTELGGRVYCFKQHGLEFVFDASDHLCAVSFFPGMPDHHHHSTYKGELPAGLNFKLLRLQAQKQIDHVQGLHVEPEPGKNDWLQYVLKDENRLSIRYGEFNHVERILEVELRKREDLLQDQAAWRPELKPDSARRASG